MKLMSFLDQVTKMNSSQLDIGKITLTYRRPVRLYLPLLEGVHQIKTCTYVMGIYSDFLNINLIKM